MFDDAGFGSQRDTYRYDKKKYPTISVEDARNWLKKNIERKCKLRGMSSAIANEPREEYQMDLFFPDTQSVQTNALIMADISTKFTQVVPSRPNHIPYVLAAIKECLEKRREHLKPYYQITRGHSYRKRYRNTSNRNE